MRLIGPLEGSLTWLVKHQDITILPPTTTAAASRAPHTPGPHVSPTKKMNDRIGCGQTRKKTFPTSSSTHQERFGCDHHDYHGGYFLGLHQRAVEDVSKIVLDNRFV